MGVFLVDAIEWLKKLLLATAQIAALECHSACPVSHDAVHGVCRLVIGLAGGHGTSDSVLLGYFVQRRGDCHLVRCGKGITDDPGARSTTRIMLNPVIVHPVELIISARFT